MGWPCLTLLRNTLVGHSYLDTFVGHSFFTRFLDTFVGHPCLILLRNTLVGYSYLTLSWYTLTWPYLTCFLDTFVGCSYWTLWQGLRSHRPLTNCLCILAEEVCVSVISVAAMIKAFAEACASTTCVCRGGLRTSDLGRHSYNGVPYCNCGNANRFADSSSASAYLKLRWHRSLTRCLSLQTRL